MSIITNVTSSISKTNAPSAPIITNAKGTTTNQAPVFSFSAPDWSYVGDHIVLQITAHDPDAGDMVTLSADSMTFMTGYTEANFAGATFSPSLPLTAAGTATTYMSWTPKYEHKGYVELHCTAQDQHGNKTSETFIFFVDLRIAIDPIPAVQLAANEYFELLIPIPDAQWHEIYEPQFVEEVPQWLKVDKLPVGEYESAKAVRISGKPGAADLGNYEFTLYLRGIFGSEATPKLHISVVSGKNQTWYRDGDGDGYGVASELDKLTSSSAPAGYANNAGDCNDADAAVHPGAAEKEGDGIDNNCNGLVDEAENNRAQEKLTLTAICSDKATEKRWMIHNPNPNAVAVSWWIHKTSQKGKLMAQPGTSYFTTTTVAGTADVGYISWKNGGGHVKKSAAAAASAKCDKKDKDKTKNKRTAAAAPAQTNSIEKLQAYPMPFSNRLHVNHSSLAAGSAVKIHLYSIDGKQYDISTAISTQQEGTMELQLDNIGVPAGVYILKLWVDQQAPLNIRVIKKQE